MYILIINDIKSLIHKRNFCFFDHFNVVIALSLRCVSARGYSNMCYKNCTAKNIRQPIQALTTLKPELSFTGQMSPQAQNQT